MLCSSSLGLEPRTELVPDIGKDEGGYIITIKGCRPRYQVFFLQEMSGQPRSGRL
jgi:hypothetical protein